MNYFGQLAQQLRQYWNGMSFARRSGTLFVLLLAMGTVLGVGYYASQPDYRVLGNGLAPEDVAAITGKLQAQNVPYRLDAGGTTVMVPVEQLAQTRVLLAAEDLPGKSGKGFELFDQAPLGMTPFTQHVNLVRAQQAELARTIMQIDPIVQARVHLVRADPSPFLRDQKPTTASVVVRLKPGATLSKTAANGIVAFVANSVEGLMRDNVTLMDTSGHTLSEKRSGEAGAMDAHGDQRRDFEKDLSNRAETMLAQALGPGRAIVRVTADVNFKRSKENKVTVSQEGSAKSSESTTSSKKTSSGGSMGIVGTGGNPPKGGGAVQKQGSGLDTEETIKIEYIVPKSTQEIEDHREEVERLTVAALVDLTPEEKDGKTEARMTLAEAEELIKRAVGFKTGRDDIKVTQVRLPSGVPEPMPDQEWESIQRWQTIATVVRNASLGLAALAGLLLGWMALRRLRTPLAAPATTPAPNPILDRMAATAQQNPEVLARVLAKWLEQSDRTQRMAA